MNGGQNLWLAMTLVLFLGFVSLVSLSAAQEPTPQAAAAAEQAAPVPAGEPAFKEDPGAAPVPFTQALLDQIGGAKVAMDTVFVLVAGFLVFFMHMGFSMLETGLCRAKNAVTILSKNVIVFAVSSIAFLALGFGIMFGDGNALFGTQGLWFVGGPTTARPSTTPIRASTRL